MEYTQTRFKFDDDYEGAVEAVLIRAVSTDVPGPIRPEKGIDPNLSCESPHPGAETGTVSFSGRAILYLHGYVDYFFQTHMAEAFTRQGWNFYALELRRYGRSLLPHQTPFYCRSLREYYPEIDKSIETIRAARNSRIVLLGHSTGGLIASLYAREGRQRASIDGIILNSPFFEFNTGWFKRAVGIPLIGTLGRIFPYARKKNELSPYYFDSVHASEKGEWDFDTRLKPKTGVPLYFAWLGAIRQGHRMLRRGLRLEIPALVLHAEKSVRTKYWMPQYHQADAVLQVKDMARLASHVGDRITVMSIPDGIHDLVLSRADVRDRVFRTIFDWLDHTLNGPDLYALPDDTGSKSDLTLTDNGID